MTKLRNALRTVDDDYLIGLSNKGIVKRAYKDQEEVLTWVLAFEEEATVTVGEETVQIRYPLAESTCSCPSRSICRHVILGILVLQAVARDGDANAGEEKPETAEGQTAGKISEEKGESAAEKSPEEQLLEEIAGYPPEKLQKKLGKRYSDILKKIKAGREPAIAYGRVIKADLFGEERVSLLSPLEYSTCTCHKKELCVHKAEAVLWVKVQKGMVTKEQLFALYTQTPEIGRSEMERTAEEIRAFLTELLETGLSRTAEDSIDFLERLAIQAHNAGLADFEGHLRSLAESYQRYFKRVSSFRERRLLEQILRLYARCEKLLSAGEDSAQILTLAGQFRAEYEDVGTLELSGVTVDAFEAQAGYAGETVYFLEEDTGKWYTYTVARPVFYDNAGRQKYLQRISAPWNLNVQVGAMAQLRLRLENAKADARNRLSSTQDSHADILEKRFFQPSAFTPCLYRDFGELFLQMPPPGPWLSAKEEREQEIYVFVQPSLARKAFFDKTGQKLVMQLFDGQGREVRLELPYTQKDEDIIQTIEWLKPEELPCFFGVLYGRDGLLYLRPIGVFKSVLTLREKRQAAEAEEALSKREEMLEQYDLLLQFFEDLWGDLEKVFQSGCNAVTPALLEELRTQAGLAAQYGLSELSERLLRCTATLEQKRHSLHRTENEETIQDMLYLVKYLYFGSTRAVYDKARERYRGKEEKTAGSERP